MDVETSLFQWNTALNPTAEDFSAMAIVRDTMGDGAKHRLAKRKLDCVGDVCTRRAGSPTHLDASGV